MANNVIDMKTKGAIFNPELKTRLQDGLKPYLGNEVDPEFTGKIIDTCEQIICTSLVLAARNIATKIANKITKHFES